MQKRNLFVSAAAVTATALLLSACSSGGGGDQSGAAESGDKGSASGDKTISVVFQETPEIWQQRKLMDATIPKFNEVHPDVEVKLEPVASAETDYFTRLQLMHGSPSTAPDVIYQDTFQVRSDAAAGYLAPLDDCVAGWDEWSEFEEAAAEAGKGDDGKLYGVSMGTDTRGIYYNKDVLKAAGLPDEWQPTNWDEMLDAARKVKESDPEAIPLAIPITKAQGEGASMQGFQMLLYGTDDTLYNDETQQWIVGSKGMVDALTFLQTAKDEGLLPPVEMMLDTNFQQLAKDKLREGKVGLWMSGSWEVGNWLAGENAWPEWQEHVGIAMMPTQDGQAPGFTSMSGGWLLSMGSTADPEVACDFIKKALDREGTFMYDTEASQIAVRKDVATDPDYLAFNPSFEFFSSIVPYTHFRPATPDYPGISDQIQIAAESVVTGQASPEQAAKTFDEAIERQVGPDKVVEAN